MRSTGPADAGQRGRKPGPERPQGLARGSVLTDLGVEAQGYRRNVRVRALSWLSQIRPISLI